MLKKNRKKIGILGVLVLLVWASFQLFAEDQGHDHNEKHTHEKEHIEEKEENHHDHKSETEGAHNEKEHAGPHDEEGHTEHHDENSVKLTDENIKDFKIITGTVNSGHLERYIELPGEIVINGDKIVHFVPRFTGVVKKINKHIGDKVRKGAQLAVIESNQSFQNYSIKSEISGTVIEKHLNLGEIVKEDSEIYVVADLRTVWVNLFAYQQDVLYLKKGQKVIISVSKKMPTTLSKIEYVSPILDEKTRTALVRVQIENKDHRWRPGTFVKGKVVLNKIEVPLLVAKTSIQTIGKSPNVFIKEGEEFKAIPVQLGREDDQNVEILSGLKEGQDYVKQGAFTLKADLEKGQLGDGHNH